MNDLTDIINKLISIFTIETSECMSDASLKWLIYYLNNRPKNSNKEKKHIMEIE